VRIVMLGHSNAGKTTYMAAMYAAGRAGIRGFRIRATDPAREAELLRNAAALRHGRFPPPSARHSAHEFVLSHRGRDFFDFTWNDYRGGALTDSATDRDTAQVLGDLAAADGIVVFVDAQALARSDDDRGRLRRTTVLLQRTIANRTRAVPLVIAYTKADLVSDDPAVWQALRRPLDPIVEAAASTPIVVPTVVRVSCGARPQGVQVPLLWCLSHGVLAEVTRRENAVTACRDVAALARAKASIGNEISSLFKGTESYSTQAANAEKQAKQQLADLAPLLRPAERLAATLARSHRDGAATVRAAAAATRESGSARRQRRAQEIRNVFFSVVIIVAVLVVIVLFMNQLMNL
jgi:signal recognition particle receptor subunit beta